MVIDHHQSFVDQLKAIGFESVDYLLCLNSASLDKRWQDIVQLVVPEGKICNIDDLDKGIDLEDLKYKGRTRTAANIALAYFYST